MAKGYSDNLYSDMSDFQVVYHNMIESFGERAPFVTVGWGAGGETFYKYARDHPDMVHSIVFMDTYPIDIEFRTPYVLKNWTERQRDDYKRAELASRRFLLDIIDVIAAPFGLMSIFVPPPIDRYPPDRQAEMRWFFLTDRTWVGRFRFFFPGFCSNSTRIEAKLSLFSLQDQRDFDSILYNNLGRKFHFHNLVIVIFG